MHDTQQDVTPALPRLKHTRHARGSHQPVTPARLPKPRQQKQSIVPVAYQIGDRLVNTPGPPSAPRSARPQSDTGPSLPPPCRMSSSSSGLVPGHHPASDHPQAPRTRRGASATQPLSAFCAFLAQSHATAPSLYTAGAIPLPAVAAHVPRASHIGVLHPTQQLTHLLPVPQVDSPTATPAAGATHPAPECSHGPNAVPAYRSP